MAAGGSDVARLTDEAGRVYDDPREIARELTPLGVRLECFPVDADVALVGLLAEEALDEAGKERVLVAFDSVFARLAREAGYQARDLVVIHPRLEGLGALLARFDRCHRHDDDEVRYVVDGEGVFGFVRPDTSQVELTVVAGDYINVPAQTEHWFRLSPRRRIKAVRYFTSTAGWVPRYTGTEIRFAP
jgi:1,2-dihydroxy-3-keto-5-methylthiopentene dioxygenase